MRLNNATGGYEDNGEEEEEEEEDDDDDDEDEDEDEEEDDDDAGDDGDTKDGEDMRTWATKFSNFEDGTRYTTYNS